MPYLVNDINRNVSNAIMEVVGVVSNMIDGINEEKTGASNAEESFESIEDNTRTIINATGFYTGREVKMMFVLAKKRESTIIFRLIKDIDPNAFVSQSAVIGVYGEGFDHIKVK